MRAIEIIRKVAPRAKAHYLEAFEQGDEQIAEAGITNNARMAHFLAQTLEETGGYTVFEESGNYSAKRIKEVWPSRPDAVKYAHNPEGLFNSVYANRMGNGPPSSGDGYRYRGRGVLQTTGREAYRKYGKRMGVDLEKDPQLILKPENMLSPALAEWVDGKCNAMADKDDIRGITKRINGGYTNIDERRRWLAKVKGVMK